MNKAWERIGEKVWNKALREVSDVEEGVLFKAESKVKGRVMNRVWLKARDRVKGRVEDAANIIVASVIAGKNNE